MSSSQNDYTCSFCSKPQAQVKRLIAGPDRVFICDECVTLCDQIISEEATEKATERGTHEAQREIQSTNPHKQEEVSSRNA